ncbi:hypothetical protein PM082_016668 [Marasmius tenuissimus]|nr:hypothetical protein PM082_016668 [Marasmius tenuissimus]
MPTSRYHYPVYSEEILPLSIPWERFFDDGSSFVDMIRDYPLQYRELYVYGGAANTRDYIDADCFEVPAQDYMPNRYVNTTHLLEDPNHETFGGLNPFTFFDYFEDLYVCSVTDNLCSLSTDLPIQEWRPFVRFQETHQEMVRDGSFHGCTDIIDYIRTVEGYSGVSYIDAIPFAKFFYEQLPLGDPARFGLLSGGSWFDCPRY